MTLRFARLAAGDVAFIACKERGWTRGCACRRHWDGPQDYWGLIHGESREPFSAAQAALAKHFGAGAVRTS